MPDFGLQGINFVAVLVVALTIMPLGAIWYTLLFAESWPRWQLIPEERLRSLGGTPRVTFFIMFLAHGATTLVIAWLWLRLGITGVTGGLATGLLLALGTVVPFALVDNRLQEKSARAFAVDAGFQLLVFSYAGILLAVWR
jgi:hypothetical protein